MESTKIGTTGVEVPLVIFGTSSFGNLYRESTAETKREIIRQMMAMVPGTIALDSAGKYGAGLALESLGCTLSACHVPRQRVLISNKLGWRRVPLLGSEPTFEPGVWVGLEHDAVQDISYDGILRCWEEGQHFLGGYEARLLSVHDPDEYLAASRMTTIDRHVGATFSTPTAPCMSCAPAVGPTQSAWELRTGESQGNWSRNAISTG